MTFALGKGFVSSVALEISRTGINSPIAAPV